MNRVEELKELIKKYDSAYRIGNPIIGDYMYDKLVDELIGLVGEDDDFFNNSIKEDDESISSDRREQLPEGTIMASMNKAKNFEDLTNWIRLKNIPTNSMVVITPKYDGISLLKKETTKEAWTRGGKNNKGGLKSGDHLKAMNDISIPNIDFSYGECIISRENLKKYIIENGGEIETSSARNIASGFFRRDDISLDLSFVDFIKYGVFDNKNKFISKKEMLDYINDYQKVKVPYKFEEVSKLTDSYLHSIYKEYSKDYEIDGLIIEIDNIELCEKLGRERSGNPKFAIAFKSSEFDESKETIILDIEDNISKNGSIIPVAILKTVNLGGANVSRVTLNNYSFLKELGVGIGSIVRVVRSGAVIPLIKEVVTKKEFKMPDIDCYWDGVHLKTTHETDEQKKKRIFSFFKIIGVENASDKTFDLLFDSGHKTIKDILSMSKEDFLKLERFGEKKADNVYDEINSKLKDVPLSKLQHASGMFNLLGSKKLLLLEHFETKPSVEDIINIEGFSDISAKNYLDGYDNFFEFIKDLPISWTRTKKIEATSNQFAGKQFVFTGFRNKEAELEIQKRGGIIGSSVSKNTSYLVMKSKGSGSSKETKAISLGVTIFDEQDIISLLNL